MKTSSTFALLALSAALTACGSLRPTGTTGAAPPEVPAAIAVPTGNRLAVTLKASGLQNYECRARGGAGGGYDWTPIGPEAALRDPHDVVVGRESAGPTWEHGDDSRASGRVLADAPSPAAGNLPWLLLQATPAARPGTLAGVTYVQRIHTNGGTAPSDACGPSNAGSRRSVRFSADYLFYKS